MRYVLLLLSAVISLTTGAELGFGQRAPVSLARRIAVRPDSRVWLEGSSNVRDWTCKATAMDATIDIAEPPSVAGSYPAVKGAFVKVPVRMLKCGDRHMEAHMYTALKAPDAGVPTYIVADLDGLPITDGVIRTMEVSGRLAIAGVERPIRISVLGDKLSDGTLRARGTLPILMTDYGITPPRPWGGILKTANKVLIQFEIFVDPIQ